MIWESVGPVYYSAWDFFNITVSILSYISPGKDNTQRSIFGQKLDEHNWTDNEQQESRIQPDPCDWGECYNL